MLQRDRYESMTEVWATLGVLLLADAVFSLKCYQCNSSSIDAKPLCDRLYWKQMSTKEREDLIIDCLERLSYFCIVIRKFTTVEMKEMVTTRGCMGSVDSKGTTLGAGCVVVSELEKACLCTDNLCNTAPGLDLTIWTIMPFLVSTFLLTSLAQDKYSFASLSH